MGLFNAVCSIASAAVSAVGSAMSSAASYIGGAIGKGISTMGKVIMEIPKIPIEEVIEIITFIGNVIEVIGKVLGLIEVDDTAEELGAKAQQDGVNKPEDFDSTEEYIEYLKNEVELDKEKFEKMSKEEKLVCTAVGSIILSKGISENKGIEVSPDFLVEVAKQKMKVEEVEAYMDNFKSNDLKLSDLPQYLKGELTTANPKKISCVISDTIKALNSDMVESDIEDRIDEMADISIGR